jgi:DNA-binding transcriptional ArsR family regulator
MNPTAKMLSPSDLLAEQFLEKAKEFQANVELIKVLKSRTYQIGEANVLVRASSDSNRRYFYGINYITVEEIAKGTEKTENNVNVILSRLRDKGLIKSVDIKGRTVYEKI